MIAQTVNQLQRAGTGILFFHTAERRILKTLRRNHHRLISVNNQLHSAKPQLLQLLRVQLCRCSQPGQSPVLPLRNRRAVPGVKAVIPDDPDITQLLFQKQQSFR